MSMIDAIRNALAAIEPVALYKAYNGDDWPARQVAPAIAALRTAIADAERCEPVAWRTFDGEGGYDLRLYAENENYRDDYIRRNGAKYASWIDALYTHPPMLTDAAVEREAQPKITDEMIVAAARVLSNNHADACGVDPVDTWTFYAEDFKSEARAALAAAWEAK